MFSKKHIKLDSVDSTNNYALSMKETLFFKEGLVVASKYQTCGNGQRGKFWESSVGENVLISVVIEPNIPAKDQFLLSQCVALALYDLFALSQTEFFNLTKSDGEFGYRRDCDG